jgi:retron-type reverse transcriptase
MEGQRPEGRRRSVSGGPLDGKPFEVSGYEVWEAWRKVRENKGAPGVDGQSIADFEERLEGNLYKIWNRIGRGAHDALAVARKRCWDYDWVIDLDVEKFFDSVPHDLVVRSVERLGLPPWVLLYVKRWLAAPAMMPDGQVVARDRGTPQGSLCSAEHNPPYAQCRVMRSAGLAGLVDAGSAGEHCA